MTEKLLMVDSECVSLFVPTVSVWAEPRIKASVWRMLPMILVAPRLADTLPPELRSAPVSPSVMRLTPASVKLTTLAFPLNETVPETLAVVEVFGLVAAGAGLAGFLGGGALLGFAGLAAGFAAATSDGGDAVINPKVRMATSAHFALEIIAVVCFFIAFKSRFTYCGPVPLVVAASMPASARLE